MRKQVVISIRRIESLSHACSGLKEKLVLIKLNDNNENKDNLNKSTV